MRRLLLCTLLALSGTSATASSIVLEKSLVQSGNSVQSITCPSCPEAQIVQVPAYKVPELKTGVVEASVKDWYGSDDLVRVDKFMGGSPVMTVSKQQAVLTQEIAAADKKIEDDRIAAANAALEALDKKVASTMVPPDERGSSNPGVDTTTTTAAVGDAPTPAPFDPSTLQLRLN